MSDDRSVIDAVSRFSTYVRVGERDDQLKAGDGGGTSDGMEPRVAKLEAHMEHVRADLAKLAVLPERLARLEEKVSHLPSKGFIVTSASASIVLLSAVITFADKLRALVSG